MCEKGLSFADCELFILRMAVDNAEEKQKKNFVITPEISDIIEIVEDFIRSDKFICYGGTAINNILPEEDQFYTNNEVPDYDFFSTDALKHAKKLADLYFERGYTDIIAKPSAHVGTFKVYVNGIAIADITHIVPELFNNLYEDCIRINGIMYANPRFLRQSMYLELSSPAGEVDRWEKVLKRLTLLNKHYPIEQLANCSTNLQRGFHKPHKQLEIEIFNITRDVFIQYGCVFLGAYADSLFSRFMPREKSKLLKKVPDFDVLATNPLQCLNILVSTLKYNNITATFKKHEAIGELISEHYEVTVGKETIAFIYQPVACHSYNVIEIDNRDVKIGTIDTLLTYYLAFVYSNRTYFEMDRIMCMCHLLFNVQQQNRLNQKGLLKRFTIECYGKQKSLESIREFKKEAFERLKNDRTSEEFEQLFLKYTPGKMNTRKVHHTIKNRKVHHKKKTRKFKSRYF